MAVQMVKQRKRGSSLNPLSHYRDCMVKIDSVASVSLYLKKVSGEYPPLLRLFLTWCTQPCLRSFSDV